MISDGKVFVIAEAGSCHGGDLARALEQVRIARQVGADAVKFQFWSDAQALADQRGADGALAEAYEAYALPQGWLPVLATEAMAYGLAFGCTVYLPQDVAAVDMFVSFHKVASFESIFTPLLAEYTGPARAADPRTLLISLGLGTPKLAVYDRLGSVCCPDVRFLHCVSSYPAPVEELNLARIRSLDGYSDHSGDVRVGALAVAAGAKIIEAHLRLDATRPWNPDYGHSLAPAAFAAYVEGIRFAEACLGSDVDGIQPGEMVNVRYRSEERNVQEASGGDATGVR